jgi:DUF971 family protein
MNEIVPQALRLTPQGALEITWSDHMTQTVAPRDLRRACPCARCRAEALEKPKPANPFPVLTTAQAQPLAIARMTPVGNYAYSIEFSDGHNTGIYSFEFLRQLGALSPYPPRA